MKEKRDGRIRGEKKSGGVRARRRKLDQREKGLSGLGKNLEILKLHNFIREKGLSH